LQNLMPLCVEYTVIALIAMRLPLHSNCV
jgi:hypothetical protein